jgi:beta-phosphoglucomutase-like phosphatase (HAD superfamily)
MQQIVVPDFIKGLIFDCDGTLVDSMPLHMRAWEYAIRNQGGVWNFEFIFSMKGMNGRDIVKAYNRELGLSLDPAKVSSIKQQYFIEHYTEAMPLELVVDVVRRYHGVLPMAVASGGSRMNVHRELEHAGLIEYFPVILTADDDVLPKPAPDIFLEAARLIDIPPARCQVFEDGDMGLNAARAAGMLVTDVREYGM